MIKGICRRRLQQVRARPRGAQGLVDNVTLDYLIFEKGIFFVLFT